MSLLPSDWVEGARVRCLCEQPVSGTITDIGMYVVRIRTDSSKVTESIAIDDIKHWVLVDIPCIFGHDDRDRGTGVP